ncbi:hypothetical protein ACFXO7_37435, partial [Nocardia tengchongensis]
GPPRGGGGAAPAPAGARAPTRGAPPAENVIADHAVARETLRRLGVRVIAAAPDRLPEALADEYLELKRTGAL